MNSLERMLGSVRGAHRTLFPTPGLIDAFCPSLWWLPGVTVTWPLSPLQLISPGGCLRGVPTQRGRCCDKWFCWNGRALTNASLIHHRAIRTGTLIMYYVSTSSECCHSGDRFINRWGCRKTEGGECVGGGEILCLMRRRS